VTKSTELLDPKATGRRSVTRTRRSRGTGLVEGEVAPPGVAEPGPPGNRCTRRVREASPTGVDALKQSPLWRASYTPEDDVVVFSGRSRLKGPGRRIIGLPAIPLDEVNKALVTLLEPEPFEVMPPHRYFTSDEVLSKTVRFSDDVTVLELPPAIERGVNVTRSVADRVRRRAERRAAIRTGLRSKPRNLLSFLREQSKLEDRLEGLSLEGSAPWSSDSSHKFDSRQVKSNCNTSSSPLGSPAQPPVLLPGALDAATKARRCVRCLTVFSCGRRSKSTHCPACRGIDGVALDPNPLHPARIRRAGNNTSSLTGSNTSGYPIVKGGGGYGLL